MAFDRKMEKAVVLSQERLTSDVYDLRISLPDAEEVSECAGQFMNLYPENRALLLPRPISIAEAEGREYRLIYRVLGKGTAEFSGKKKGDILRVLGPLGTGFPLREGKSLLIGGGIGIPPMLALRKALLKKGYETAAVLGYRDEAFLQDEFALLGDTYLTSDRGTVGRKGTVTVAIEAEDLLKDTDTVYACGPLPMLKAVKRLAEERNILCYLSLEERMACGVGACLGCVTKTKERQKATGVHSLRVCKEGPVFDSREVLI